MSTHASSHPLAVPPRARDRVREAAGAHIAALPWWLMAGGLLLAALVFHSKTNPGERFEVKLTGRESFGPAWFTEQQFGQLTPADLATFAFAYLALIHRITREGSLDISGRAVRMSAVIGVPILAGTMVGLANHTDSPFGDWRNLVVGAMFAIGLWSVILTSEEATFRFARLFVVLVTGYGLVQLVEFAGGGGEIAYYGRTPTGDHATLEFMVAAVAISLAMLRTGRSSGLWWLGIIVCTVVVVLAFRRYAWVELGVVFAAFVLLSGRNRGRYLMGATGIALAAVAAVAISGSSLDFAGRLASLDPFATKADTALAATNQAHVDEIYDGLDQVNQHPLLGLGVGKSYVGERTARWKGDAGMVHNGPLEMWIKFTVLGLIAFFVVYFVLFRAVWQRRSGTRYSDLLAWGAGSFLLGQFLVTVTVYAWPFGAWEKAILVFALIAMMFPRRVDEPPAALPEEAA